MHKSMTLVLTGLLLAGVAAAQIPAQSAAELDAAANAFALRPGVVVSDGRIYAMHPEGGVDALSATSGAVEWHSDVAERPLGMYGALLASQAGRSLAGTMSVVFLDASGAGVGDLSVDLEPGVLASATDNPRGTFDASMRLDDGQPVFEWRHHQMRFGAVPRASSGPTVTKGAVQVDPATGARSAVASRAPAFDATARDAAAQKAQRLVPGATSWLRSADDRHFMVSKRVKAANEWLQYSWSIFDQASEAKLGEVPSRLGAARFFIRGGVLIYESSPYTLHENGEDHGLELHAVDLASGNVVWVREIRDTEYTGPLPH